ncbi:MAG: hypothetical protein K2O67_04815, partial [Clostridia bacterium]|nr:hypothetical protein [Clostridia bacterium]
MKDRHDNERDNGNAKLLILIILIVGLFVLLGAAVITYFAIHGGDVPILSSNLKYLFFAFIVLLPLLILFLILASFARPKSLMKPEDLGVDFKKIDRERPKLENLDNYNAGEANNYTPVPVTHGAAHGEVNEDINTDGSRFYMLTQIDKEYESYVRPDYDDKINLKELCEDFRNFSAGTLRLYYDIEDIRRFIGGLAVTKLIILQGMSGTGKTSLASAFGEYLGNKTVVVPI